MNKAQQAKFNALYEQHLNALHRQGKAERTIDSYARAIRRITAFFDQCPDRKRQKKDRHPLFKNQNKNSDSSKINKNMSPALKNQ